jgi:outer membrane immunogenic protein
MAKLLMTASAIAALATVSSALAADLPVKAPPMIAAPVFNWTGCYIGAEGGGNWGSSHLYDLTLNEPLTNRFNLSGELLGVTGGCNWQVAPHWFAGFEGDFSWTNKSGIGKNLDNSTTNALSERWFDTARVRLGYGWDRWLIYATAGPAFTDTHLQVCGVVGCFAQSLSRIGWAIGGGVEARIAGNWSAKLEYLHADFGSADYVEMPAPPISHRRVWLTDDIVRAGVNYRFDWGGPVVARY